MTEDFVSSQFWAAFAAAIGAISVAATAGLIRMFFRLFSSCAMAHPKARSSHKVPKPAG